MVKANARFFFLKIWQRNSVLQQMMWQHHVVLDQFAVTDRWRCWWHSTSVASMVQCNAIGKSKASTTLRNRSSACSCRLYCSACCRVTGCRLQKNLCGCGCIRSMLCVCASCEDSTNRQCMLYWCQCMLYWCQHQGNSYPLLLLRMQLLPCQRVSCKCKGLRAGYMVARVLGAAPILADAIIDQLAAPSDKAVDAGMSPMCYMVVQLAVSVVPHW